MLRSIMCQVPISCEAPSLESIDDASSNEMSSTNLLGIEKNDVLQVLR